MSDNTTTLIPRLCCRNAAQAAEFYQKAFGAELKGIFKTPDGLVMHAVLQIEGVQLFLVDEMPEHGAPSPLGLNGTTVSLYLRVPDSDASYARAVSAGCEVKLPIQDMFWGDRYALVQDPYGHKWEIATTKRTVSEEELQKAVNAMKACSESAVEVG